MLMRVGGVGGSLNDFKFGSFIGRFPSDGVASVAIERLIKRTCLSTLRVHK